MKDVINELKSLYLSGEGEEFLLKIQHLKDNSIEAEVLKLLGEILKVTESEKYPVLEKLKNIEKFIKEDMLLFAGIVYILGGDVKNAKRVLGKIAHKNIPYLNFCLGSVCWLENDFDGAKKYYEKEIKFKKVPEAYQNLGVIYLEKGEIKKAKEMFINAWLLKPFYIDIAEKVIRRLDKNDVKHLEDLLKKKLNSSKDNKEKAKYLGMLGMLDFVAKNYNESFTKFELALKLNEGNKKLRWIYIMLLLKLDKTDELEKKLIRWIDKYNNLDERLIYLELLIEKGNLDNVDKLLEKLKNEIFIPPHIIKFNIVSAKYFEKIGKLEEAKKILEISCEKYPYNSEIKMMLYNIYNAFGEFEKSQNLLKTIDKEEYLIRNIKYSKSVKIEELNELEKFYELEKTEDKKATIAFSLASGFDKIGNFEKASFYIKKANEMVFKNIDYSIKEYKDYVKKLIISYSKEWVEAKQNNMKFEKRPIFIVGMPRSGTTMLEQIFSAHNKVFGAGELDFIFKIIRYSQLIMQREYPYSILYMPKRIINEMAIIYLNLLKEKFTFKESVFVDKMPHNFLHSPLLVAMFSNSKVIALRRDYRSIALSNYFQNFVSKKGILGYAFDLKTLGEHLKFYIKIMDYYKEILPKDRYQEFWYEDLVLNSKEMIPKVLEFCELDFTPEVLEFYKNKTAVKTASILQVRNPIYKKSVESWKNYKELLKPVIDIVGDEGIYEKRSGK